MINSKPEGELKPFRFSITITVILYLTIPVSAQNPVDHYTKGLMLKNSGKVPMALFAWVNGRNTLAREGKTDPRIWRKGSCPCIEQSGRVFRNLCAT